MPDYKLMSAHWDGEVLHPKGSIKEFEEGKAPKTARKVEAPAKPKAKTAE